MSSFGEGDPGNLREAGCHERLIAESGWEISFSEVDFALDQNSDCFCIFAELINK